MSDFRANTATILEKARSAAVLLDVGAYQALFKELETLRDLRAADEDIEHGRVLGSTEARERLLTKYRK